MRSVFALNYRKNQVTLKFYEFLRETICFLFERTFFLEFNHKCVHFDLPSKFID